MNKITLCLLLVASIRIVQNVVLDWKLFRVIPSSMRGKFYRKNKTLNK